MVTFTRSAAAELKARIASALSDALAEHPDSAHLQKQLFLLGSAQISTIDSFFGDAVRKSFDELGLPASFRLADKSEILPVCLQVMDATIRDFYEKNGNASTSDRSAFERLTNNRFAAAMNDIMANRSDASLDEKLIEFASRFAAYPEGLSLLRDCAADLGDCADRDFFDSRVGARLLAYLTDVFSHFSRELAIIGEYLKYDADAAAYFSGIHASDSDLCAAVSEALSARSFAKTRQMILTYQKSDFPRMSKKPPMMETYHKLRNDLKSVVEGLQKTYFSWGETEVREQMLRTAALAEVLCDLFEEYNLRILEEKRERGLLEFDDVRSLLYRLLLNPDGTPSPYARSLSDRYDAVYIDEYQDVDYLQDRIFSIIGEGRRFMVGDIKQSIYGFRGSEPSIFSGYRRSMPLHDTPEAESSDAVCVFMSENFRCDRPVIDFANSVCSFLFSACEESVGYRPEDDLKCGKLPPEQAAHPPIDVQTVVFEPYPKKKKTATAEEDTAKKPRREAVWIAAEIARLLRDGTLNDGRRIEPSDIAILARTAAQGAECAKELKALGIPFSSKGDEELLHSPLMTDTLNLLRAIDNPYRDLPLSEYLLSPMGGFTLDELSAVRESVPESRALYDALTETAANGAHPIYEKASAFVSWLEGWRRIASGLAADRLLRLLYLDPCLASNAHEPELLLLYEQARLYQRTSFCGLFGFLAHVTAKIERGDLSAAGFRHAESAVNIMTVHGSKGLEFPVVFLAFCGASFKRNGKQNPLYYHRNAGFASGLYRPEALETLSTLILETVKNECRLDETEEAIRTLYVALTRARERMYVTGTLDGKLDSALASARMLRRGSRYSILSAGSYLRWILAALSEKHGDPSDFPCIFRYISLTEEIEGEPFAESASAEQRSLPTVASAETQRYAEILARQKEFRYPADSLRDLPTKAAASKLRPDLLDLLASPDDDASLTAQIRLMEASAPAFEMLLDEQKRPNASEIGTATHTFLEFCSLDSLSTRSIEEEISRLVSEEFITAETAALLNREWLHAFVRSDLADQIAHAAELRREQKFSLLLPLSSLTKDRRNDPTLAGETVFVQGSIDLILKTADGRLLLFDYKTDRISDEEKSSPALLAAHMKEKHGYQLSCYALAVKQLFGKAPDAIFIYSIPLGRSIPIETDVSVFEG